MDQKVPWGRLIMNAIPYELVEDVVLIGRCDLAHIKLPNDEKISIEHCRIAKDNLVLTDLSSNGTYVNDRKVGKGCNVVLSNGDQIQILHQSKVGANASLGFKFELYHQMEKQIQQEQKLEQQIPLKHSIEKQQEDQSIREEITCPICSSIIYQPVSVHPCGHSFCGGCLGQWEKKEGAKICPMDRMEIDAVAKSVMLNGIIQKYLKQHPLEIRTESDRKQLDSFNLYYNQPQQQFQPKKNNLQIQPQRIQQVEDVDEDSDESLSSNLEIDHHSDYSDEDEDEEDDNYNQPILGQRQLLNPPDFIRPQQQQYLRPLVYDFGRIPQQDYRIPAMLGIQQINMRQQLQPQPQLRLDCKSCGQAWKGFQCQEGQQHTPCGSCDRKMPLRILDEDENAQLQLFCQICKDHHCRFYYGDCSGQNQKMLLLKDIGTYALNIDQQINMTEQNRIKDHLRGRGLGTIFNFIIQEYIAKGLFFFVQDKTTQNNPMISFTTKLLPDTPICWLCIRKVTFQMTFRYVQIHKYDEGLFMNEDCRYGVNCRINIATLNTSADIIICVNKLSLNDLI